MNNTKGCFPSIIIGFISILISIIPMWLLSFERGFLEGFFAFIYIGLPIFIIGCIASVKNIRAEVPLLFLFLPNSVTKLGIFKILFICCIFYGIAGLFFELFYVNKVFTYSIYTGIALGIFIYFVVKKGFLNDNDE